MHPASSGENFCLGFFPFCRDTTSEIHRPELRLQFNIHLGRYRMGGFSSTRFTFWVTLLVQWWLWMSAVQQVAGQGSWQLLVRNAGVAAMHCALSHYDTAIILDRTNIGPSQIRLAGGRCRDQPLERVLKHDCTAHSIMFTPGPNKVRPLFIYTDTWCSSGQFMTDGTLVQTGGDFEGNKKIRTLAPCPSAGNCDWVETNVPLAKGRWYSSNQVLPGGNRQIVVGGRVEPTYEFVPKRRAGEGAFPLAVLQGCCDNLYPFVYLLPNGDLYVFTNRDSVTFNYNSGRVTRKFPTIPGNPRNYPSAGSAAMLPLTWQTGFGKMEIVICGGAATGASTTNNIGAPASASCGRMVVTAGNANWAMENMPIRRNMGEMINLPTGEILIINGAQNGFQGWGKAGNPALNPVKYNPGAAAGKRFQVLAKTNIPRMYHSTANLLTDGRILAAGSNTHQFYTFTGAFPTELRIEAFSPPYRGANFDNIRPQITGVPGRFGYKQVFTVNFVVGARVGAVVVNMNSAPFSTHSYSQGQRQLTLQSSVPAKAGRGWAIKVTAPPNANVAPQQYYMLFVVQNGIPGKAAWVHMG